MNHLWRTLPGHRTRFALLMAGEAISSGVEALLHPLLLKALFDQAVVKGGAHRFIELTAYYLALGLSLNVLVDSARVRYGGEEGADLRVDAFRLDNEEHVLLRGPNGSGKTTLLRLISGTLAPDVGTVTLPPRVVSLITPVNLPPLPVRELAPDAQLRGELGLDGLAGRLPAQLSSGQRQRLGVAALLSEDADVYLADEPFANLDDQGREVVLRLLTHHTRGRSLLVVPHGNDGVETGFDRVVTLSASPRTI